MTVTGADLECAARVMGLSFTPSELAQMLEGIEAQIDQARARRAVPLDNDVPMACRFDPRPVGWIGRARQDRQVWSDTEPGPLPDRDEDIAFAALPRLSSWIRSGSLTSRRLTEIYLSRIARHGPRLECFATVLPEIARAQADEMDALLSRGEWLGPLHGIPYGAKDLLDAAGTPTSWGAEPYAGRVAARDAHVVTRLREAGAVLVGKTTLGALAYGDVWDRGVTRNPWNPREGSSGSSAGSASTVAAGLCGFAIGSETMGSITSPSDRCGVTGLRPTFGRVGRSGAMTLCWSLDKLGPMARGVEDCAMILAAINGADPQDRCSLPMPFEFGADASVEGMRVGFVPAAFQDREAPEADLAALEALRALPVDVVEVALPDLPIAALMPILYTEAAAAFEELTLTSRDDELRRQDADAWPNLFRRARFFSAVDLVQADRLRHRVMEAFDGIFRDVDAMIGPFGGDMLVATNFTGHPCLHLPTGFREAATRRDPWLAELGVDQGDSEEAFTVPRGISLWAGLFDEGRLMNLGLALEAALGVAGRRPGGLE